MNISEQLATIVETTRTNMYLLICKAMGERKELYFTEDYGFESLVESNIMYITPTKLYYGADDEGNGNDTLRMVYESDNETFDEPLQVFTIEDLLLLGDIMAAELKWLSKK